ncbi:hypothetical protein F7725_019389 [Dissostichus mawsoni]|uniref:nucleoside diphosphate phosphatase n=2 Tax=Notothenioidei TaxID=8205 RepID=A0A7J5YJX0_DISMA|nr:hypothetical protein F7725_019389 [Dissostichus mawsoni]
MLRCDASYDEMEDKFRSRLSRQRGGFWATSLRLLRGLAGEKMTPAGSLLLLLLLSVVHLSRAKVRTSLLDLTHSMGGLLPSLSRPANHSRIFYSVMFDAGSTGTRIHVYTFIHGGSEELPVLDNEMFHSIKPGLSAYADSPEMWKRTPLLLRATAGLRLLSAERARLLLEQITRRPFLCCFPWPPRSPSPPSSVSLPLTLTPLSPQVQHVFDESPFLVPGDSISIMNGTNEGILAWISVNYLTGHLNAHSERTVGILDLGGGSTQITFLPKLRVSCWFCTLQDKTIESVPVADYVAKYDISNSTFELYTYSYLGNGLMAARLATLGALGAEGTVLDMRKGFSVAISCVGLEWRVFKSSCLPKKFRDEWSFGGLTYRVSGDPDGKILFTEYKQSQSLAGYKLCYQEVLKVVKGIIHQPYELQDSNVFYAFSYYFDRAVDAGLIDGVHGGRWRSETSRRGLKRPGLVSSRLTGILPLIHFHFSLLNDQAPPIRSFLCMDMTYITCLLKDGFGFKESTVLQLTKKVNNVEASWALGATLDHLHDLKIL